MAGALFAIDQDRPSGTSFGTPGVPRKDLWLLRTIRPQIASPVGNNTYLWELLDCPLDSNLRSSLGGPILPITGYTTATPSFDPDKYGPYRLRCTTNGGGPGNVVTLICHVRFDTNGVLLRQGRMLPAFGEVASEDDYEGYGRGYATQFEDRDNNTRTRIEALEATSGATVPPGSENQIAWSNGTTLDFDSRLEFIQNVSHSELHLGVKALLDAHNTSFRIFASNYDDVDDDGVSLELYGGDSVAGLGGDVYIEAGGSSDIGFKSGNIIFQAGNALNGGEPGDIYLSPGASGVRIGNTAIGTQDVIDFKNMQQGVFLAADGFVAPNEDPAVNGLFMWSTTAGALVTRGSGALMRLGNRILDAQVSAPTLTLDADLVTWPAGILADIRPSATGFGMRLSVTGSGQFIRMETTQANASIQIYSNSVQYSNNAGSPAANFSPTGLRLGDHTIATERLEVMGNVAFDVATVAPKIYQKDVTTASATGQALTIQAQNATGSTSIGGEVILQGGTGTSTNGNARLSVGAGAYARVVVGGVNSAWVGLYGPDTSYGSIWLGTGTPSSSNYAITAKMGDSVFFNATASFVFLKDDAVPIAVIQPPGAGLYGFWFSSVTDNAEVRFVTDPTNGVTAKNLTIRAQNASGTTSTGGTLNLTSGTGTTAAGSVNIQVGGVTQMNFNTTNIIVVPSTFRWTASATNPVIDQGNNSTNGATGQVLTVRAQNATGTTSTGGDLNLTSGTGTSAAGVVNLQSGGSTKLTVNATGVVVTGTLSAASFSATGSITANSGGAKVIMQGLPGSEATFGALYMGTVTPDGTNFVLLGNAAATNVSLNSVTTINLAVGGVSQWQLNTTTITMLPVTLRWATATVAPRLSQQDDATNSVTGDALTIQAQNATGTTSTGGDLTLTSGTGTSTHGSVLIQVGGSSKFTVTPVAINAISRLIVGSGSAKVTLDSYTGSPSSDASIWLAQASPGNTNYALDGSAGDTTLNAPTTKLWLTIGGVTQANFVTAGMRIGDGTNATARLDVLGAGKLGVNTGKVYVDSYGFAPTTHGAIWLGNITPDNTNLALGGDGTSTTISGLTRVQVAAGATVHSVFTATGLSIGTTSDATEKLDVIGRAKIGVNTGKVFLDSSLNAPTTEGSIWLGTVAPTNVNYVLRGGTNFSIIGGGGGTITFQVGAGMSSIGLFGTSGLRIGDSSVPTERLELTGNIKFDTATTAPKIFQDDNTTNSATGQTLLVQAQNATGTTSTGGMLDLRAGTGTTTPGDLVFRRGNAINVLIATGVSPNHYVQVIGGVAVYLDGDDTYFRTAASGNKGRFTATGLRIGDNAAPTERLEVLGNIKFDTTTTTPKLFQADNTTNSATATSLTVQAQNATGTTSTGGLLILTSGTGTTVAGNVELRTGGTARLTVAPTGITLGTSAQVHQFVGGVRYTVRSVAGAVTIDTTTTDYILKVDTSAARSITLPTPTAGRMFLLQDATGSCGTNNITLIRSGSEKIQGLTASYVFSTDWGAWLIWSDGTDWFIK